MAFHLNPFFSRPRGKTACGEWSREVESHGEEDFN